MKPEVEQALIQAAYQKMKDSHTAVSIARWILKKCGGDKQQAMKIHSDASFKWQMEYFEGSKEHPGAAAKVEAIKRGEGVMK